MGQGIQKFYYARQAVNHSAIIIVIPIIVIQSLSKKKKRKKKNIYLCCSAVLLQSLYQSVNQGVQLAAHFGRWLRSVWPAVRMSNAAAFVPLCATPTTALERGM